MNKDRLPPKDAYKALYGKDFNPAPDEMQKPESYLPSGYEKLLDAQVQHRLQSVPTPEELKEEIGKAVSLHVRDKTYSLEDAVAYISGYAQSYATQVAQAQDAKTASIVREQTAREILKELERLLKVTTEEADKCRGRASQRRKVT